MVWNYEKEEKTDKYGEAHKFWAKYFQQLFDCIQAEEKDLYGIPDMIDNFEDFMLNDSVKNLHVEEQL